MHQQDRMGTISEAVRSLKADFSQANLLELYRAFSGVTGVGPEFLGWNNVETAIINGLTDKGNSRGTKRKDKN